MIKKVTFDFYKVEMPSGYSFESAIEELSKVNKLEDRVVEIDGDPLRWEEADTTSKFITGDLVKLRMYLLPSKGGLHSKVEDIGLNPDEGIAEETVFLYDKQTHTLVYQRNRYGVSASRFQKYLLHFYKLKGGTIDFLPLLRKSGLERLEKIDEIRKFSYRVARPTSNKYDRISDGATEESIELLDDLSAMSVNIELSMGHYKGSMAIDRVKERVKKLFRRESTNANEPKKIYISGVDKYGTPDQFDLLDLRIKQEESLKPDQNRRLTYAARKEAADNAFRQNIEDVEELYEEK